MTSHITELLTVQDAEELPHGTDSVLRVGTDENRKLATAVIDQRGVLRSVPHGDPFPRDTWEVIEK